MPWKSKLVVVLGVATLVTLGAILCFVRPGPGRGAHFPDIVLVTLDTTRADHLGAYGYFRKTSPNFDALATHSVLFDHYMVPMATTLPSHTSIFTSALPIEHGVEANLDGEMRFIPAPGLLYFAEYLGDLGYDTAAFVSARPLGHYTGAERGFSLFNQPDIAGSRDADVTTDLALEWLATQRDERPVFLWVHYFDPHTPYQAPKGFLGTYHRSPRLKAWLADKKHINQGIDAKRIRRKVNRYDEEIRFMDAHFGRFITALSGREGWDRTVLVVAGDHGEGLGQHGEAGHGRHYNGQLHSPLLLRAPGLAPGRHVGLVSAIDVIPTVLGQIDLDGEALFLGQASGRDVLHDTSPNMIWAQSSKKRSAEDGDRAFVLLTDRWKYVRWEATGAEELYDLAEDAYTQTDVASENPKVLADMADRSKTWEAEQVIRREKFGAGRTGPASKEMLRDLEALGYVVGADDESARSGAEARVD